MQKEKVKEINEYRRKRRSSKNVVKLLVIIVLLIIIVLGTVFLIFHNEINLPITRLTYSLIRKSELNKKDIYRFDNDNYFFDIYKNNIVMCSKDGIKLINKSGEDVSSISYNISNPLYYSANDYLVVADKHGKEINLLEGYYEQKLFKSRNDILTAKINPTGYTSIITEEKGYKGTVEVFNPLGENIYVWHSVDNYIIDTAVSSDGQYLAISILNDSKIKLAGGIMLFKMDTKEPITAIETESNLFTNIEYLNDSLTASSNNQFIVLNKDGNIKWEYNYENMVLSDYDFDYEAGVITVALNKESKLISDKSEIIVYNDIKRKGNTFTVNDRIKNIIVNEELILFNSKKDIILTDTQGNEILSKAMDRDIKEAFISKNNKKIITVTSNKISVLEVDAKIY